MMENEKDEPQHWYQDGELVTVLDPAGRPGLFRVCVVPDLPAGHLMLYPDGTPRPTAEDVAEMLAELLAGQSRSAE